MFNGNILKNEEAASLKLRSLYSGFGYNRFKMSKFEEYDLYVKNKDFLISDGIITFTDTNGKLLALKPDVTLSIIKNSSDDGGTKKLYHDENVYRISGDSKSFKEITQTGLDIVGVDPPALLYLLFCTAYAIAIFDNLFSCFDLTDSHLVTCRDLFLCLYSQSVRDADLSSLRDLRFLGGLIGELRPRASADTPPS
jgi:histidyl-tRNA synthetase